jgi:hypothetical protein
MKFFLRKQGLNLLHGIKNERRGREGNAQGTQRNPLLTFAAFASSAFVCHSLAAAPSGKQVNETPP